MTDTKVDGKAKLKQVEAELVAARKAVTQQSAKLAKARTQSKAVRGKAAQLGTKAGQAALLKARETVRSEAAALEQLRGRVRQAVTERKAVKLLVARERVEQAAQARVDKVRKTIETRLQRDLAAALGKFEKRWKKRRAAADQRKLKSSQAKAEQRVRVADKKLQTTVKALEKRGLLSATLADAVNVVKPAARTTRRKAVAANSVAKAATAKRAAPAARAKAAKAPKTPRRAAAAAGTDAA